jgi:3-hydroxybutyrate dehydrogenase
VKRILADLKNADIEVELKLLLRFAQTVTNGVREYHVQRCRRAARDNTRRSSSGSFQHRRDNKRKHVDMSTLTQTVDENRSGVGLIGKSAIVTGSTSGIGLGIAEAFAKARMNVMLNGFGDRSEIDRTRRELEERSAARISYHGADMTKPIEIQDLVSQTILEFGQVDVVVNNAGIQHVAPVEDFPVQKWDAILAINLASAFHAIRLTVPHMKAAKWGRIINIASAHGLVASPFKSAYVAAKHGMLGLTKTVALETAEHGITVNAICPGYVLTPLLEKQIPDTAKNRGMTEEEVVRDIILGAQPTKKFVTTEQLGALAVFLCTDAAASITGAALPVDGGWTAH